MPDVREENTDVCISFWAAQHVGRLTPSWRNFEFILFWGTQTYLVSIKFCCRSCKKVENGAPRSIITSLLSIKIKSQLFLNQDLSIPLPWHPSCWLTQGQQQQQQGQKCIFKAAQ